MNANPCRVDAQADLSLSGAGHTGLVGFVIQ